LPKNHYNRLMNLRNNRHIEYRVTVIQSGDTENMIDQTWHERADAEEFVAMMSERCNRSVVEMTQVLRS
jgi:hypothetical protein